MVCLFLGIEILSPLSPLSLSLSLSILSIYLSLPPLSLLLCPLCVFVASYDPPDSYYLLSDILPEDKQLRGLLQQKRLVS